MLGEASLGDPPKAKPSHSGMPELHGARCGCVGNGSGTGDSRGEFALHTPFWLQVLQLTSYHTASPTCTTSACGTCPRDARPRFGGVREYLHHYYSCDLGSLGPCNSCHESGGWQSPFTVFGKPGANDSLRSRHGHGIDQKGGYVLILLSRNIARTGPGDTRLAWGTPGDDFLEGPKKPPSPHTPALP